MRYWLFILLLSCQQSPAQILGIVTTSPVPYGDVFNYTSFSSTGDFTTSGSWTVSGGKLIAPANNAAYITYPEVTCVEQMTKEVKFYCTAGSETGYLQLGLLTQNAWDGVSYFGCFDPVSKKVKLFGAGQTFTSSGSLTYSTGDSIDLVVKKIKDTVRAIATSLNNGTKDSVSTVNTYLRVTTTWADNNTAKFCIKAGNESYAISKISWSIQSLKNADRMAIGNSITHGAFAESRAGRWGELAGMEINAGSSDRTTEVLLRIPQIIKLAPKKVFLLIGTNDLGYGYSSGTWQANYSSIVSQLQAAGITVICCLLLPRNDISVTTFNNWIIANYPSNYIDTYTPLWSGSGTGLKNTYDSGDGLHPNAAGDVVLANTIMASTLY